MFRRCCLVICLWLGIILPSAMGQQAPTPLFDYQTKTLANGMTIITLEDFSCPIVSVQVWYNVGSRDERPDRQGYAHMFEHMMFKGTPRVSPSDHFELIRSVGGTCNAYTSFDQTVYYQTLPSDQLELAFWLEAERMAFLKIDQQAVDTERKVIEEELRKNENEPYGTLHKKIFAAIFDTHPYRWTPIGNISHLRATSTADLREFWSSRYIPSNATLIIVGAVKHQQVQKLAETYFGWIQKHPVPQRRSQCEPMPAKPKIIEIADENAPAAMATLAWRTIPMNHPDREALDFLAEILGSGKSSRLYRQLVAEKQLAVDASAGSFNLQQDGLFQAEAVMAPGADTQTVIPLIEKQILAIQQNGVSQQELEKARHQQLKSVVQTNLTVESKARLLGTAAVTMGDVSQVNQVLDRIRAVTAKDIQRVAKQYLTPSGKFTFIIKQNDKGMAAGAKDKEDMPVSAAVETNAPAPGRPGDVPPASFPKKAPLRQLQISRFPLPYDNTTLSNGLKVITITNKETPFVGVLLGLRSGAAFETKPGTAKLAMEMLTRGTRQYSEAQMANELENYAIAFDTETTMDTAALNLNCLAEHTSRALSLMSQAVFSPLFDPNEFNKLRTQALTELSISMQNPEYLADKEFKGRLFGQHPYARKIEGSPQDIQQLCANDLKQWWDANAHPQDAVLIFAGDIDTKTAADMANQYFGSWKNKNTAPGQSLAAIPPAADKAIYVVDLPGSAQVQILAGQTGLTRSQQPDFFTSRVLTMYFGASFNSRLNETLRVKKGLTYGAFGGFLDQYKNTGLFTIETFTKNESAGDAVQTILDLIDDLRQNPPSPQELNNNKNYILGSFAMRHETPMQIAKELWTIESENLAKDYLDSLLDTVSKTTAQDCLRLAQKTIHPQNIQIVVVGDAAKIQKNIESIAPTTVVRRLLP